MEESEQLAAYWRERCKHFEAQYLVYAEKVGDLNAQVSSLKARLKELEEIQSAVQTAGMAVRNTDSGPNLVSI